MIPARGASAKAGAADSEPFSSRQRRVIDQSVPLNINSDGDHVVRVFPAACKSFGSAQSAIRSLPGQGYKKAKSVGRRQGNQAAHSF